jgi:hypothetical protein
MSVIPFLLSYEPYQPPTGTRVINSINDMVTISFNPPSEINYNIGTDQQYNDTIIIRNTTSNVTLEASIEFNDKILSINTNNTTSPYVFRLAPNTQTSLPVQLKFSFFNQRSSITPTTVPIKFTVKNLTNGSVALKNI